MHAVLGAILWRSRPAKVVERVREVGEGGTLCSTNDQRHLQHTILSASRPRVGMYSVRWEHS